MRSLSIHLRTTGHRPEKDELVELAAVYFTAELGHDATRSPYAAKMQARGRVGEISAPVRRVLGLKDYDPTEGHNFYDAANLFIKWGGDEKFRVLCYNPIRTSAWLKQWLGSGYSLFFDDDHFVGLRDLHSIIVDKYFARGMRPPFDWHCDLTALYRHLECPQPHLGSALHMAVENIEIYRRMMAL